MGMCLIDLSIVTLSTFFQNVSAFLIIVLMLIGCAQFKDTYEILIPTDAELGSFIVCLKFLKERRIGRNSHYQSPYTTMGCEAAEPYQIMWFTDNEDDGGKDSAAIIRVG